MITYITREQITLSFPRDYWQTHRITRPAGEHLIYTKETANSAVIITVEFPEYVSERPFAVYLVIGTPDGLVRILLPHIQTTDQLGALVSGLDGEQ